MLTMVLRPVLLMTSLLLGQAAPPETAPHTAMTAPATSSAPAIDPAMDRLLNELEQAGQKFTAIQADVEYVLDEPVFGTKDTYMGQVYYQKDPEGKRPSRFRIHFDTLRQANDGKAGPTTKADLDYVFDGVYFIIRKANVKQMTKYQVAEAGQPVEALELGKGPFPVPFGQKKEQVLKLFDAATRDPKTGDMPDTRYLKLTPKPGSEQAASFQHIEMWINAEGLPTRIKTADAKGQQITTVTFRKIKTDVKFDDKTFELPAPPDNWDYHIEQLRPSTRIKL